MECLPKFFPPSVIFFGVNIKTLPSTMVLNNGIMATPRIRLLRKVDPHTRKHSKQGFLH